MTPSTLSVDLVNQTGQTPVYAYVTGTDLSNNQLVLLEADGQTLYYPSSPSGTNQPLQANCSIELGGPGASRTITIPQIAGGRVWFSIGSPLTFQLNPGPALVEPSVTNPSDPNINIFWDFCEFTFNSSQLFANISYVDFFSIPVAMDLAGTDGSNQHVSGTNQNGLATVVSGLKSQQASDGVDWTALIVNQSNGQPLRVLSPNNGLVANPNLFANYWTDFINQVWSQYTNEAMSIDTQASYGTVTGQVSGNTLTFTGGATFSKPDAQDIFTCSTGPFAGNSAEELAITPRIAAAFNRSVIQNNVNHPDGENPSQYYQTSPTNHYARIVHAANLDGHGYAFPYDDVTPTNGTSQAGVVSSGVPQTWTITVGGNGATA